MRPVLITRGSLRVWSYPALLYTGLVAGIVAQNYAAHAGGMDGAGVWVATLLLLPCALVGARGLYVVTHWHSYRSDLGAVWDRSQGGLAMYGAIPVMVLASIPVLGAIGIGFWGFWDVSVFCMLVGMIFARMGCLLNGCCSGRATRGPFGLWLTDHRGVRARRIPTQLFEAGLGVVLLAGAAAVWPRLAFHGELFLLALAGYAGGRFVLQMTRDERTVVGSLDLQQAISVAIAAIAVGLLVVRV